MWQDWARREAVHRGQTALDPCKRGGGAAPLSSVSQVPQAATLRIVITAANTLVALMAALHVYILVLEMFLWTSERARRAFGTTPEFAAQSRTLAANQGLYNGILAAGLVWGLIASDPTGFAAKVFFLGCIAVAGLYGALTASRRILFVQTVPALVTLALVLLAR